jgi:hypothetical protein
MNRLLLAFALMATFIVPTAYAQKAVTNQEADPRTSPAYAVLIERRVKVRAQLETLLNEYSSTWPEAVRLQAEFDTLKSEMKKMSQAEQPMIPKLTAGYGMLLVQKATLAGQIQLLLQQEGSEWPPLKEKQRELELLDKQVQKVWN